MERFYWIVPTGNWDWSLLTGKEGRGATKDGRGASEVLPLRKPRAEKVLAVLKGGTTSFEVVLIQ